MSAFVNSLIPSIESILRSADLDKVSAKSVRKTLIAQGVDEALIKQHKEELDKRIEKIYLSLPTPEDDIKPKIEPKPSSQTSNTVFNPITSPQVPLNSTSKRSASPTKKPKKVKPPLIDEDADAAFARKLQAELDASTTSRSSRATSNGKPAKRKIVVKAGGRKKSAATIGSGDESELDSEGGVKKKKRKSGGGGAFNALMLLSEPLADLTGQTHLSRPGTVKAIWDHVKANNLQDASDKRFLICDEKMKKVFGSDRIHMFTMNKVLGKHLFKPEDIVQ